MNTWSLSGKGVLPHVSCMLGKVRFSTSLVWDRVEKPESFGLEWGLSFIGKLGIETQ